MRKILFILLIPFTAFAQQIVITGQVPDCPDSVDVFMYKPIGTYFNAQYKQNVGKVVGHQFKLAVPMTSPGFVILESKHVKSVLFVEPGDYVDIGVSRNGSQGEKIYKGNNAAGHELFNNETPLSESNVAAAMEYVLDSARTVNGALWGLRNTLGELKSPLLAYLRKGEISVGFYENMVTTLEGRLVYHFLNTIGHRLDKPEARKNKALTDKELKQLLQDVCELFDPFDTKYTIIPDVSHLVAKKCYLIQRGFLRGAAPMNDFWLHFDESSRSYAYAPSALLEMNAGNEFVAYLTTRKVFAKSNHATLLDYFKYNFPKSAYLPVVEQLMTKKG
ncbi:hypothetical protein [Chitinophaga rhizophila]|uniref:Uncharacterized protein n=1 Tax=Chitinophaga rhizophila TaxID=2866212 RepID=A0ABS7GD14_9BACT|nr:hypothetical protein [Chitinophaga rhizophila]MBW8685564.1 hypothetical protein [Chitinophaga rhizophila]